jgi:hypothetical protein
VDIANASAHKDPVIFPDPASVADACRDPVVSADKLPIPDSVAMADSINAPAADVIVPEPDSVATQLSHHARLDNEIVPTHLTQVVLHTHPLFGANTHVYGGRYP